VTIFTLQGTVDAASSGFLVRNKNTGFVHLKMDEDSVLVESILVGGAPALR
jgi:hypothetical protein